MLARGESVVAWSGLVSAGAVAVAMVGATAWGMRDAGARTRAAEMERTLSVGASVAAMVNQLTAPDDLTALRSLVAGVPAATGVTRVRVLAAGADVVLADSAPNVRYAPLPETWGETSGGLKERLSRQDASGSEVTVPVTFRDRGAALVTVRTDAGGAAAAWSIAAGNGAIGAGCMVLVWAAYRGMRRRMRVVGAVRDALRAVAAGERSPETLAIAASLGPEAGAWNRLVRDAAQQERREARERQSRQGDGLSKKDGDLAGVLDGLWQGLMVVDERGVIRFANGAAAIFVGAKREDLEGQTLSPKVCDEQVRELVLKTASGAQRARGAVEVRRAGAEPGAVGSLLRYNVRPLRAGERSGALVVIEDITQQRVADDARNAFVASATHELRTPLTNVRLYVDQLVEEPNLEAGKRAQALNVVSQEIRRLERLVGDILSVSEIEAGQMALHRDEVRLEPIFEEMRADFEEQARQKGLRLSFELPPKWPRLVGDRDKIVLALHNLVGNAIKYTPAGGQVLVHVSEEQGKLSVEVADTGIGIAEEEADLVFEKFYRAKDKRVSTITGTGLGLSIAREVIRLHGGDIGVKSKLDQGTTFTVNLPLAA